jgi:uncharacterized protein (DUF934 family)
MAQLIKNRRPAVDPWQLLEPAADGSQPDIPPNGDVIVPLFTWLKQRDALLSRSGRPGVWLDSNEEPALIADDLRHFGVVAVNFPQFTDGRGYSIARLLRERYRWRGELRAIGDVQRDQLFYLARCGFDAFALRESGDMQSALTAFGDFSEAYQTSVERSQPLFRRRALASPDGMERP